MSMLQLGVTKRMSRGNWKEPMGSWHIGSMDQLFHCLRFLRMFSPQFAVSQKRSVRSAPAVVIHSVAHSVMFSKKEKNEKRRGKKKWRDMFPERVARIDVFVPFRLYEYISVAFVVSVLYVSSPLFPLVVSGPW